MLGKRCSLMLFLRGLPQDLTHKKLKLFVQGAVKDLDRDAFSVKATVCTCSIIRISDPDCGECELFGLVEIQPAKAAMHAIEVLNGKDLNGELVEVRRYHHRTPLRERRLQPSSLAPPNKRKGERRRTNLRFELVST